MTTTSKITFSQMMKTTITMLATKRSYLLAIGVLAGSPAASALEFYGEINMSRQEITEDGETYSDIRSNGSAIGVMEERTLNRGVSAEFLLEYEIMPNQPVASSGGSYEQDPLTLSAGYVGLIGSAGKLKIGYFATPLNILGEDIDHFTDLRGDKARYITTGDVDISNAFMYTSPEWRGLTARISHVSYENSPDEESVEDERSNGVSVSVSYEYGDMFTGIAYDSEVEGEEIDLFRAVARYPLGPVNIGVLWERRKDNNADNTTSGWLASATAPVTENVSLQFQHGRSDNVAEGARTTSLGAAYDLGNDVSLYVFATDNTSDDTSGELGDESEYGLGISYVF
jgi:predicted porin